MSRKLGRVSRPRGFNGVGIQNGWAACSDLLSGFSPILIWCFWQVEPLCLIRNIQVIYLGSQLGILEVWDGTRPFRCQRLKWPGEPRRRWRRFFTALVNSRPTEIYSRLWIPFSVLGVWMMDSWNPSETLIWAQLWWILLLLCGGYGDGCQTDGCCRRTQKFLIYTVCPHPWLEYDG